MSGPRGGIMRVPPMREPSLAQVSQMAQREREEELERQAQSRERHFRALGKLQRHGVHDSGCPKCGQATIGKVHCPGRERGQTTDLECYIFGDHLHAQCATCKFVWVERCKDDDLDRDWRGGLRYDEMIVDGVLVSVPVAPAAEQWGVGEEEKNGE